MDRRDQVNSRAHTISQGLKSLRPVLNAVHVPTSVVSLPTASFGLPGHPSLGQPRAGLKGLRDPGAVVDGQDSKVRMVRKAGQELLGDRRGQRSARCRKGWKDGPWA